MKLRDAILWPLSLPYEMVTRLHARAYRSGFFPQRKLDAFVISVGNLTVGGTGKTPMVLWIAEHLVAEGKSVGILTRGYRGKPSSANATTADGGADLDTTRDESTTSDSTSDDSTSDEVRLLKSRLGGSVAFGVGPDRFANGANLVVRGVKCFVLDDGFQHRRLARDVDIVLIDATDPFGGGHLLPAGRLREPRSALGRAGIIVITRGGHAPAVEAAIRQDSKAPIFYARPQLESVRRLHDRSAVDLANLRSQKLFAFCGIGNPRAFLVDLREWGFQIAGHKFFPDHHRYTRADALAIESEARNAGAAALVCTEKDLFNLRDVPSNSLPVYFCRISFQIDRPDAFWAAIKSKAPSSDPSA
ncbi:MAG TPA: tetraacyldisaccharide 4'-kinase [Candidatus Acidoferrales bacterium]|jgi:tetraacyldisaccharide 4'-kinase|nr:tetraacyldisaccharide 4'-kinase [Candidatus Acidoferrales bacterium]